MRRIGTIGTAALTYALSISLMGCGEADGGDGGDGDGAGGKADDADDAEAVVCVQDAVHPNTVLASILGEVQGGVDDRGAARITNYTAWPIYDPGSGSTALDPDVTRRIDDPKDARANLASRFGSCEGAVAEHMDGKKPNVYIYFTGFGGADQNNSLVEQGAILKWINDRDPNALIYSINWNCADSDEPFCGRNTDVLAAADDDPHVQSMFRAIDVIVPQIAGADLAAQLKATIGQFGQQQRGYDSALSHSMWLAARLIDQLLVANEGPNGESLIGDIHVAGYSMGAHAAARLLIQDFTDDGSGGYKWSRSHCAGGGDQCTVAELDKVKWSLAMGLSGWSHALTSHNDGRSAEDKAQFENGGLFRVADQAYEGKLAVLNRRMDPTANADDTFQRGFLDLFFGDYNHYSHDYSLPLFIDTGFVRALDAFLESGSTQGVAEIGIVYDNASRVDFDECDAGKCDARTGYVAHEQNRSHAVIDIPRVRVETTDGVEHPEKTNHRAVSLASGADPVALRTFDQEDLRGGVELQLRPHFDPADGDLHGLFSYGSCGGSDEDLMPEAFIDDGAIVFQMRYEGEPFVVKVDAAAAGLRKDDWSHLAFTWELPVESMSPSHQSAQDLGAALPGMLADLQEHQVALVLATGLRKPLATTYKRQAGEGTLRIFVNGEMQAEAALGTPSSSRECLAARDVLASDAYSVNGATFPAFAPYARYDAQSGDVVAFSPDQVLGTKCKAYRIRNEEALFGCAQSNGVNADADMDDITIIWGPGRTEYDDIDHDTGTPVNWPIGVKYGPDPLKL